MHTQKPVDVKLLGQFTPEGFAGANTDGSIKAMWAPTHGAQLDMRPQSFSPEHFKLCAFPGSPDTPKHVFVQT